MNTDNYFLRCYPVVRCVSVAEVRQMEVKVIGPAIVSLLVRTALECGDSFEDIA